MSLGDGNIFVREYVGDGQCAIEYGVRVGYRDTFKRWCLI